MANTDRTYNTIIERDGKRYLQTWLRHVNLNTMDGRHDELNPDTIGVLMNEQEITREDR